MCIEKNKTLFVVTTLSQHCFENFLERPAGKCLCVILSYPDKPKLRQV